MGTILQPGLHGAIALIPTSPPPRLGSPKLAPSARMDAGTAWPAFQRAQTWDSLWAGRETAV